MSLAEIREHSLFTYLHTCNVATLSMSFGMALGMPAQSPRSFRSRTATASIVRTTTVR